MPDAGNALVSPQRGSTSVSNLNATALDPDPTATALEQHESVDAVDVPRLHIGVADTLRRGSLIVVWIGIFLAFGILRPNTFLTVGTMQTIFGSQQALVFIALGALCAFSVGEFDFSVAAVAGLSAPLG